MKERRRLFIVTLFLMLTAFCVFVYISNTDQVSVLFISDEVIYPPIILDAGHGGEDGGAVASDGTIEKDINLNISLQMQSLLSLYGFDCIMIRSEDEDLADHSLTTIRKRKISDITARSSVMEANPDAVYVSIHQNQYADRSVRGLQVFYSVNHENSKMIADCVQQNVINVMQNDNKRKIKAAGENIYLLHHANIPAIMVECGFMSNFSELALLKTQAYGTQLAFCIVGGIVNYYNIKGDS